MSPAARLLGRCSLLLTTLALTAGPASTDVLPSPDWRWVPVHVSVEVDPALDQDGAPGWAFFTVAVLAPRWVPEPLVSGAVLRAEPQGYFLLAVERERLQDFRAALEDDSRGARSLGRTETVPWVVRGPDIRTHGVVRLRDPATEIRRTYRITSVRDGRVHLEERELRLDAAGNPVPPPGPPWKEAGLAALAVLAGVVLVLRRRRRLAGATQPS